MGNTRLLKGLSVGGLVIATLTSLQCGDSKTGGPTDPQAPTVGSVSLNRTAVTFDVLEFSVQLNATVKNSQDQVITAAVVAWSTTDDAVVTIDSTGLLTSKGNGSATVTAKAEDKRATAAVSVQQIAWHVNRINGSNQRGTVGQLLLDSLTVEVNDRTGHAIASVPVAFQVDSGSTSPSTATTNTVGRAGTAWTLGPVAGAQVLRVAAGGDFATTEFTATADPDLPDSLLAVRNDIQAIRAADVPLEARVIDRFGNGIANHLVTFVHTAGAATLLQGSPLTGPQGIAITTLILGTTDTVFTVEASAADVQGSPVTFRIEALRPYITSIEPDTLREFYSATVHGPGLEFEAGVVVDRMGAETTEWGEEFQVIEVPEFDCRPARLAPVWATDRVTQPVDTFFVPLVPTFRDTNGFLTNAMVMAPGEQLVLNDPYWPNAATESSFCLQLPPSAQSEEFLIGIGISEEAPDQFETFYTEAEVGRGPSAPTVSAPVQTAVGPTAASFVPDNLRRRLRAEQRIRALGRRVREIHGVGRHVPPPASAGPHRVPPGVPRLGDTLTFRVPDLDAADPCSSFREIGARVVDISPRTITAADTSNPGAADSLTFADVSDVRRLLDSTIYPLDSAYFGEFTDLDTNERVYVVPTIEVNKMLGGASRGFMFAGDLFDLGSCASSDFSEIIYVAVPDVANTAGTIPRTKDSVLAHLPRVLMHESTHLIQCGYRRGRQPMHQWDSEGQALLAEEVLTHAMTGRQTYQDYGAADALASEVPNYRKHFTLLAAALGWDGMSGKHPGTPEDCTLFGSNTVSTACDPLSFYGAAWSFVRYLSDRFSTVVPGGEHEINRRLAQGSTGAPNFKGAVGGVNFEQLLARWGAALYADGDVPTESHLQFSSWRLGEILGALGSGTRLDPPAYSFTNFTTSHTIRAGGTAFLLLNSSGAHPSIAVRISFSGTEPSLDSFVWVARIR